MGLAVLEQVAHARAKAVNTIMVLAVGEAAARALTTAETHLLFNVMAPAATRAVVH